MSKLSCYTPSNLYQHKERWDYIWYVVLPMLCERYIRLQPYWWWWWFSLCYFRGDIWLWFSFTRNEQQSLYTLWNQWQAWRPIWGYWPKHAILHWYELRRKYEMWLLFWRCFQQENKQYRNKQTVIISSKYQKFTKAHWWLWIIYKLFAHKVLFYWTCYCINRYRENRRGGGVSLHIREGIPHIRRNDLEYFDNELESIFIEIDKDVFMTHSNVIIAVTYRMPDSSL